MEQIKTLAKFALKTLVALVVINIIANQFGWKDKLDNPLNK